MTDNRLKKNFKYSISSDLHTHTTFSHGKGSIEENVKEALAKGLRIIGISDHGPGHVTYGIKKSNISVMRKEIQRLQPLYPNIEILLGVEANIINMSGRLDLKKEELQLFDYLIAGYHFGVFGENPLKALKTHAYNYIFTSKLGISSEKQKNINTDLVIKALYGNNIKILSHPGDKGSFDILEIAKACANTGTLMEISTWHDYLTVEGIKEAAKTDAKFMINSDAHSVQRIGDCQGAVDRIIEAGLDFDRVVNLVVKEE